MFESFTSTLNDTLESAKNDLKHNLSKRFTVAASNLSSIRSGSGKTRLFWNVLEHSKTSVARLDSKLGSYRTSEANPLSTGSAVCSQIDMAIVSNMLRDYRHLIEAFELIYVERTFLEEILVVESELENLDDLELLAQYYKELHDSLEVSRHEVHRLMTKLSEMEDQREVVQAKNDYVGSPSSLASATCSNTEFEKRNRLLELSLKQTEILLKGLNTENTLLAKQLQERTDELEFIKDSLKAKPRSQSCSEVLSKQALKSPIVFTDETNHYVKQLEQELFECKRELRRRLSVECRKQPSMFNLPSPDHSDATLKVLLFL
jgi:hypothetical protein